MNISKTAVHDGLKDLERFGFVKSVPKQGTFVADYVETGSLETLTEIIKYNNNRMDAQTYRSILELRMVLEPLAFQRFVQRVTPADYEKLQELFDIAEDSGRRAACRPVGRRTVRLPSFHLYQVGQQSILPDLQHI